jgi:Uma2 family endonuclease
MSIVTVRSSSATIPRLNNGDHLTRDEFERRYHAMPPGTRAELIEGVVYMPSPVNAERHGELDGLVMWWINSYRVHTPGIRSASNSTVRLDLDNEPQPDAVAFIDPRRGGQAVLNDGFIEGAPELVAEIAASSVSMDRNKKMQVYRRNGVREYVLWRVEEGAIDWFVLRGGQYDPLPLVQGAYRSEVLPGLWLDHDAMLNQDLAQVLATLQQGVATPEHAAFVAQLQAANP